MLQKRRSGRLSTKISDEIAHLRVSISKGYVRDGKACFRDCRRPPAAAFAVRVAIIAYRIQADRFSDLYHETRQVLDRTDAMSNSMATSAGLAGSTRNELRVGQCNHPRSSLA